VRRTSFPDALDALSVLMAQGRDASDNRHAMPVIFRETGMRLDGPIESGCKRNCVGGSSLSLIDSTRTAQNTSGS
jgi:hypothetical protein